MAGWYRGKRLESADAQRLTGYAAALVILSILAAVSSSLIVAHSFARAAGTPPVRAAACPVLSRAAALPRWRDGGFVRADAEGAGYLGEVSVRYDPAAPISCGFVLVAKTLHGSLSVRIPEYYKNVDFPTREWPFREPVIDAAVGLGAGRSQIAVTVSNGAAVWTVLLYGVVRGKLRVLPVGRYRELDLGGTVGTGNTNVHCAPGGPLTVLGVWPTTHSRLRLGFSATVYRLYRGRFSLTATKRVFGAPSRIQALAHNAGFDAYPFTGCTLARVTRHS